MRIAVASGDGMLVDQHFGHATHFLICEQTTDGFRLVEVRRNAPACGADFVPGGGDPMERSAAIVADCQAVLVARIGECGIERLAERGIEAFEVSGPIETALRRLASGARPQPATCDGSPRDHAGSDHHP